MLDETNCTSYLPKKHHLVRFFVYLRTIKGYVLETPV